MKENESRAKLRGRKAGRRKPGHNEEQRQVLREPVEVPRLKRCKMPAAQMS